MDKVQAPALASQGWRTRSSHFLYMVSLTAPSSFARGASVETNLTVAKAVFIVASRGVVGLNVKTQALAPPKEVTLERQILNGRCSWYWCLDLFASAIRTPWQCRI